MLPSENLFTVLQNLSSSIYKGYGYVRIRSAIAHDQEKIEKELQRRILKNRRFNYAQQPTIYLANSVETLNKQVNKNCSTADEQINQTILPHTNKNNCYQYPKFEFNLSKVLDLREQLIQDQLGINITELTANNKNFLKKNQVYPTQILGDVVRENSFQGLITPIDNNLDANSYFYIVIFNPIIEISDNSILINLLDKDIKV